MSASKTLTPSRRTMARRSSVARATIPLGGMKKVFGIYGNPDPADNGGGRHPPRGVSLGGIRSLGDEFARAPRTRGFLRPLGHGPRADREFPSGYPRGDGVRAGGSASAK